MPMSTGRTEERAEGHNKAVEMIATRHYKHAHH